MLGNTKNNIIQTKDSLDYESQLVGEKSRVFARLYQEEISTPHGFVITTEVFNDFLTSNDLIGSINTLLSQVDINNAKAVGKISSEIEVLFKSAKFSESFLEEIRDAYGALTGGHSKIISIEPSWPGYIHKLSQGLDSKYTFTNITSFEDLQRGILLSWQSIFDAELIKRRAEHNYNGTLSLGLVIQRIPNAEVSGRAYSHNPLNGSLQELEIEAVLGVWRGVDELDVSPDRYVVNKQTGKIQEKNTTAQPKMLVRKSVFKPGEDIDLVVKVSKPWQAKQKASDQNILEIAAIVVDIQKMFGGSELEVEWVVDTGRIHVVGIRSIARPSTPVIKKTVRVPSRMGEVEAFKSIDNYVEEIEDEIDMLSRAVEPKKEINNDIEIPNEGPSRWSTYRFAPQKKLKSTIHEVWTNLESFPKFEVNSSLFSNISSLNGEDLVTSFNQKITKENKEHFNAYGVTHIYDFVEQDKSKSILYSPSILNSTQQEKYLGVNTGGYFGHKNNDMLLLEELKIVKNVRDRMGYRKLSLLLRGLTSVDDLSWIKKMVLTVGLRRSSTLKIYVGIEDMPTFMHAKEYINHSIDGLIINLDVIWASLFGKKVKEDIILKEKLFWSSFNETMQLARKEKVKVIAKSNAISSSSKLMKKLLKEGVAGVMLDWDALEKGRSLLAKTEVELLDK